MGAALGHLPVIKHHDLVHLIQAVQVVGDQQGGPADRGRQQIRGQGAAVFRVEVGGGLVQDEQGRVGQQRAGGGAPLPLTAGQRGAVRPYRGGPAVRQRGDEVERACA